MFNFMDMMGDYSDRKVDNFKQGKLTVDTARVTDAAKDYETAVKHPQYNDGAWVIVEIYDTKAEAQVGHDKWVKTMTTEPLPATLKDVSSAEIAELLDVFDDSWREYKAE